MKRERVREEMFTEREIERITFGGMNVGENIRRGRFEGD